MDHDNDSAAGAPDDDNDSPGGGVKTVKSAARALEVLEFLSARDNRAARLRDISAALKAPRSSLYALLRTMVSLGWVRADASGTFYGIGIRALLTGTSYLDADPLVPVVHRALEKLKEELDETFHFARLDGEDIVYLVSQESSQYLRPFSRIGRRLPAYATALGKAILASLNEEELENHLPLALKPLTAFTLTSRPALEQSLLAARNNGYATEIQESALGLKCFAVPLRHSSPVTDAISASIPIARLTTELEVAVIAGLQRASNEITRHARPINESITWS